jgi:hypothetical protein
MLVKDVLSMLEQKAYVELGVDSQGIEYVLFYSPPDNSVKIALIDRRRLRLVSIWNRGYRTPEGVKQIRSELFHQALQKQKDFAWRNLVVK